MVTMQVSRKGSVGWEGKVGGVGWGMAGPGCALGTERNPDVGCEFQPWATPSSRMGPGWELVLRLTNKNTTAFGKA